QPHIYLWSDNNAQTTQKAEGLCQGTYTVTLIDANGCEDTEEVKLEDPTSVSVNIASQAPIACFGECTARLSAVAGEGAGGYSYLWNEAGRYSTAVSATNICGNVTVEVTVTDAQGCTATDDFDVSQPDELVLNYTSENSSCDQADGSATVTYTGGTGVPSYLWNNSTFIAKNDLIAAGNHTVTVTDRNTCEAYLTANVTDDSGPTAAFISTVNVDCIDNFTGQAEVAGTAGSNGSNIFTFEWMLADGTVVSGTQVRTGLEAGVVGVEITDEKGCKAAASVEITEPKELTSTTAYTLISCTGGDDGTVTANGLDGTGPYTYSWTDDGGQTDQTITGLSRGLHRVIITDANGCITEDQVELVDPEILQGTVITTDMLCNGICNGSAIFEEISTGEGSAQSYKWSDGQGQVGPIASLLCADTYTVTVTTTKGCEREFIGLLEEPSPVNAYINFATQPLCFNDESGEACVFASGGTTADGTYYYAWNKPGSHDDNSYCAEGVLGGNVTLRVTVTDDNGCRANADTMLLNPPFLNVLTEGLDPSCHSNNASGNCDGTVTANGVGGTGALFYQWGSNTFFQDTQTAIDLCGDEYCVTVSDGNLCKVIECITIEEPSELINTDTIIDRSTCKNFNGSITIVPAGGKGPIYSVLWDEGLQSGYTLSDVESGIYCVTIVDGNNCEINECYTISDILGPDINGTASTDITCFGYDDGTMVSEPATGGTPPYLYFWESLDTIYEKREELAVKPGKYAFCVLDDNGCRTCDDGETILEPEAIGTLLEVTHIKCFNDCDGTASIQIVGGTAPYDVKWNADHDTLDVAGISKVTQGGLCANAYLVTVTDDAGCPVTIADVITEPA
ncbi:MAG: SprB repeat-containing protein, partial [Flavobacteriales bacterium]|nr:SprB repeat-containing protein [Flavobacteriales bacterium]